MIVEYKINKTDIEITEYTCSEIHVARRIQFLTTIDGSDSKVTISWIRDLMQNNSRKFESEVKVVISELKQDVLNYVREYNYDLRKLYVFEYDYDICIDAICKRKGSLCSS